MSYRGSAAYAQRRIDIILQSYKAYAKTYIDDIVIFLTTLNDHLIHLERIFKLFARYNVALNTQKAFIDYLSVTLLGQKMNGLGLTSTTKKIAVISN